MKKIKILFLFIIFICAIVCFTNDSFAFSEGDEVRCKIKSYHYSPQGMMGYVRINDIDGDNKDNHFFEKGTVVVYKQLVSRMENICEVEYKGENFYIKEGNLESFSSNAITAINNTAQKVYDKYKDVDFSKIAPYELQDIYDTLYEASLLTSDSLLRSNLEDLIEELKEVAQNYNIELGEPSTSDTWQNMYNEEQERLENEANAGGVSSSDDFYIQPDEIYSRPERTDSGDSSGSSIDDLMNDADEFVSAGGSTQINQTSLQDFSNVMYNILLTIGIVVAVIVGAIIGVKLMSSGIDRKVEAKKLLIPYGFGCLAVFGAFAIWKIVVTVLQGV